MTKEELKKELLKEIKLKDINEGWTNVYGMIKYDVIINNQYISIAADTRLTKHYARELLINRYLYI